ncbi:hypothetical protein [Rickettsiella massiliensis]|uniref:hypothetical protein n=1 Tax=Rickettsiella massiliensis TaxID=676517 RepID=UPI00029A8C39|nr:hypothetical protein [Rickettsiella massiliensis]
MTPFFLFERAVYSLKKMGCFRLTDEKLGYYQLKDLQSLLIKIPKKAEFMLSKVVIILYEADQIAWFDYKDKQTPPTFPTQQTFLKSDVIKYPFFEERQRKLER